MIQNVTRIDARRLIDAVEPEHIKMTHDSNGRLAAISWRFGAIGRGLYPLAKQSGGVWNRGAGGWTFSDSSITEDVLNTIIQMHPDWPVIGQPDKPFLALDGVRISRLRLADGLDACLVPIPLPCFSRVPEIQNMFQLRSDDSKDDVGLLISCPGEISALIDSMIAQGAKVDDALAAKWSLETHSDLRVTVKGWAVQIDCDLSNPLHYLIAPQQKYRWEGRYPDGRRVAVPWKGALYATRKTWPALKSTITKAGLKWSGDDPSSELCVSTEFNSSLVSGWTSPAPNGHLLHAYQKEGALFCARRGLRALIGDEMGVGKTVQAISAAQACSSPRILVVCPANARYVWDREIAEWGGQGAIQHIKSQLDQLNFDARWHIVTYDLVAARSETWRLNDAGEVQAFQKAFPDRDGDEVTSGDFPRKVRIDKPLSGEPEFADPKRIAAWRRMMQRLRGELLEQFLAAGPLLLILDEAHRVKNRDAKRTRAIKRIAKGEAQVLMLTGTPLRNNEHEAAVLLSLLDDQAEKALDKRNGYTIQDVKDYLEYFMIRRTKAEVLPHLPPKTRQRIDIDELDQYEMIRYGEAMKYAYEMYGKAIVDGKSDAEARKDMQAGIEMARTALGVAKVLGGAVRDLVLDVVENKECCVVFCGHHDASDSLKLQLEEEGLRVAVVDGRTSQNDRAAIVKEFQGGLLDVFIGGINAAGEAITLTRADTVVFVELDWVPAALLQAEDRIHRAGQQSNCQVIQLIAKMPLSPSLNLDEIMAGIIGSKMARIGAVLGEDGGNIVVEVSIQAQTFEKLLAHAGFA